MKKGTTQQIDYSTPQTLLGDLYHLQGKIKQKDHVIVELALKAKALEDLKYSDGYY
ncbi:hypothetical protein [Bartonella massiliensis]|uniref:hypothetical protein n=1 Tax=Bartonella massiliensis TaxID=929795 RepID=UPI00163D355D